MQANVRICGELFDCSKLKNYSEHKYSEHKFGETLYTAGLRRYSLSANDILSDHVGYSVRQVSRVDCQAWKSRSVRSRGYPDISALYETTSAHTSITHVGDCLLCRDPQSAPDKLPINHCPK